MFARHDLRNQVVISLGLITTFLLERANSVAMAVIETNNLGLSYGTRRGITGINLSIEQGQIFGFLGPNGAGKTTTIRILLGFLAPGQGQARILGIDAWKESHLVKQDVGYVAGDVRLYPWLTARRAFGIVGKIRQVDLQSAGLALCERFRLEPELPVRKMSRGNRQKVALVLALVHRPKVVILDEPTSGLDPLMQRTLMDCLRELANDGSAVLFSSHTLSEVEELCDRVAMIRRGRIVVDEALDSLRRRAPRTVSVALPANVDADMHALPTGVELLRTTKAGDCQHLELQLSGTAMPFITWAATQGFLDVSIGTPGLDSLFRQYYVNDIIDEGDC
ncbi:MAG: ABC transporter ATP-binding protein [Planctomycetaceae bacterium]